jgi:hypothetical protein
LPALRHLPVLALLTSCSVYSESLLDDVTTNGGGNGIGKAGTLGVIDDEGDGGTSVAAAGRGGASMPDAGSGGDPGGSAGGGSAASGGGGDRSGNEHPGGANNAGTGGSAPELPNGTDLLDDMEDGNFYLSPKPPRFGFWYVASDKTSGSSVPKIEELIVMLTPARDTSTSAVHFAASGFTGWGSSVGLSFTDAANARKPYDAGDAVGIAFWVRGSVSNNVKLRVLFPIADTNTGSQQCGGVGQGVCLDHFATQITVTADWKRIPIAFASLHQAGWGAALTTGFDPKTMLGIEWTADQADLDIWLDDLALIRPE